MSSTSQSRTAKRLEKLIRRWILAEYYARLPHLQPRLEALECADHLDAATRALREEVAGHPDLYEAAEAIGGRKPAVLASTKVAEVSQARRRQKRRKPESARQAPEGRRRKKKQKVEREGFFD